MALLLAILGVLASSHLLQASNFYLVLFKVARHLSSLCGVNIVISPGRSGYQDVFTLSNVFNAQYAEDRAENTEPRSLRLQVPILSAASRTSTALVNCP